MELQTLLDQLFNEPDIDKRRYIPDKLAKLGDWGSTHALGQLITDNQQPDIIRNEGVESLGKQGDPDAVPYLVEVLSDEDDDIRRTAVWSLGQIGTPTALEPIFSMIQDPSVEVRRWVAKSAGRIRDNRVIAKLKDYILYLNHDEERVLADIIRAVTSQITRVEPEEYEFWIRQCYLILQNNYPNYVKQAAILLLNEFYKREIPVDIEALDSLFSEIREDDPLVRPNIIIAMGYAKNIEFLKNLNHKNAIIARGIAGDINFVDTILDKSEVTEEIIAALEAYTYLSVMPNLEKWYNHENLSVQTQALQLHALHHLPIKRLLNAYEDNRGKFKVIELLRYYSDEALIILEKIALDDEKVARQNSVYSLISDEMIKNVEDKNKLLSILEHVTKQERIWHIRRDARIGIERIRKIEN